MALDSDFGWDVALDAGDDAQKLAAGDSEPAMPLLGAEAQALERWPIISAHVPSLVNHVPRTVGWDVSGQQGDVRRGSCSVRFLNGAMRMVDRSR